MNEGKDVNRAVDMRAERGQANTRPECSEPSGGPRRPYIRDHVLVEMFRYHPPNDEQLTKYAAVRSAAKHFAEVMLQNTPAGADQEASLRKIREAVMTANAAIALNGLNL